MPPTLRTVSPVELAERIAAERRGAPFVVYLDGDRRQRIVEFGADASMLSIGREPATDIALEWDTEVSARARGARAGRRSVDADRRRSVTQRVVRERRAPARSPAAPGRRRDQDRGHAAGVRRRAARRGARPPRRCAARRPRCRRRSGGSWSRCARPRPTIRAPPRPPTARSRRRCSSASRRSRATSMRCTSCSRWRTCRRAASAPSWSGARSSSASSVRDRQLPIEPRRHRQRLTPG